MNKREWFLWGVTIGTSMMEDGSEIDFVLMVASVTEALGLPMPNKKQMSKMQKYLDEATVTLELKTPPIKIHGIEVEP